MMNKPAVRQENYQELYEYYLSYQPNKYKSELGYLGMHLATRSRVHFQDDSKAQIEHHLKNGVQLILTPNHVSDFDQFVIAGLAHSQKVLRPLRGETIIPAKYDLFGGKPKVQFIQDFFDEHGLIDLMGAIPTFRTPSGVVLTPEQEELQVDSTLALGRLTEFLMIERGKHLAMYPEGTRNKNAPRTVQRLRNGVGHTAVNVGQHAKVAIVPVGVSYEEDFTLGINRPEVVIGELILGDFVSVGAVLEELHPAMQNVVDLAYAFSDERLAA